MNHLPQVTGGLYYLFIHIKILFSEAFTVIYSAKIS